MHHRHLTTLLLTALLALGAAGCGGDDTAEPDAGAGSPASAAEADRRVEVAATDDLAYQPPTIDVAAGETITFVVTNTGEVEHEFVLGSAAEQEEHAAEMAEMEDGAMEHGEANELTVEPGETAELTWHFPTAGELQYACHEPGHYEGGMIGTIVIE